jgi:hypothetical protein
MSVDINFSLPYENVLNISILPCSNYIQKKKTVVWNNTMVIAYGENVPQLLWNSNENKHSFTSNIENHDMLQISTYSWMLIVSGFSVLANKLNIALRYDTYIARILAYPTFLLGFPNAVWQNLHFANTTASITAE